MYDHALKKHFCCNCLQAFSTEEILKCHIKDYFKFNGKQTIIIPKKSDYVKFKNSERVIEKIVESTLMPEDNRRQNPEEPYTKKYLKHVACRFG